MQEEEKMLESDKVNFLKNVKKLRQEKDVMNDKIIELKQVETMMEKLHR